MIILDRDETPEFLTTKPTSFQCTEEAQAWGANAKLKRSLKLDHLIGFRVFSLENGDRARRAGDLNLAIKCFVKAQLFREAILSVPNEPTMLNFLKGS